MRRGITRTAGVVGVDVDLPADSCALQFLKNRGGCEQGLVVAVASYGIDIALRRGRHQVFTIRRSPGHYWREPAIRGAELRGHVVVVVQVGVGVIAHGANSIGVVVGGNDVAGIVGGGPDISIQSGSRRNRIVEIPVHVLGFSMHCVIRW